MSTISGHASVYVPAAGGAAFHGALGDNVGHPQTNAYGAAQYIDVWDHIVTDTDGYFTGSETFTIPVGLAGLYLFVGTASGRISQDETAGHIALIVSSNTNYIAGHLVPWQVPMAANWYFVESVSVVMRLAEGDGVSWKIQNALYSAGQTVTLDSTAFAPSSAALYLIGP